MPRTTSYAGLRYPLYTETADPATQTQNLATDLDTACNTRDTTRTAALHRPQVSIYRASGSQSVAKATMTTLTGYDTTYYDPGGLANTGTGIITFTQAGMYYCEGTLDLSNSGTGALTYVIAALSRNNATSMSSASNFIARRNYPANSSDWLPSVSGIFLMAATDTLRLMVQWSGSGAGPTPVAIYKLSAWMCCTNP